jgi:hypothetical protein
MVAGVTAKISAQHRRGTSRDKAANHARSAACSAPGQPVGAAQCSHAVRPAARHLCSDLAAPAQRSDRADNARTGTRSTVASDDHPQPTSTRGAQVRTLHRVSEPPSLPTGSIYPILARLEVSGLATSAWEDIDEAAAKRRRRRYYRLTPDGLEFARGEVANAVRSLAPTRHRPSSRLLGEASA